MAGAHRRLHFETGFRGCSAANAPENIGRSTLSRPLVWFRNRETGGVFLPFLLRIESDTGVSSEYRHSDVGESAAASGNFPSKGQGKAICLAKFSERAERSRCRASSGARGASGLCWSEILRGYVGRRCSVSAFSIIGRRVCQVAQECRRARVPGCMGLGQRKSVGRRKSVRRRGSGGRPVCKVAWAGVGPRV